MVEMVNENQFTVIAELILPVINSSNLDKTMSGQNVIVPEESDLEGILLVVNNTDGDEDLETSTIQTTTSKTHSDSCIIKDVQSESEHELHREPNIAVNHSVVSKESREIELNVSGNPDEKVGEAGKRKIVVEERKENRSKKLIGKEKYDLQRLRNPMSVIIHASLNATRTLWNKTEKNVLWFVRQNNFIICNVNVSKSRVYTKNNKGCRSSTLKYHLCINNEKRRVCKTFFLSTLDISEKKKHTPANKTDDNIRKKAVDLISKLSAVPSRYCRQSKSRKYLPTDIGNL
ncbi:hypothetical protein PR048_018192 [Dryococelus australis]|uniref:Uncharacterized protein n=1 Tax=Dryococelus australis TaxID=614101 RepID=A0ABQ9HBZ2_9NEOP|nr:hypothetical protein PR048_018192 [Dryococelus australis]